ncbi:GNAT family N-acetyltransferase [Nocardioides sp. zg-579]|uniref:GNAT family N-acetyltransferase n=2 Tax=Nocardioides marmotae TaxID=2663857 RepID=A0A6I3JFZ8_9ACTN|nr:GNAT family N-acetyltransferase [Gordonia jinghuaiqii]MTB97010.1 GNAT family N-acetyltransferase [Nocardioides marmotae]
METPMTTSTSRITVRPMTDADDLATLDAGNPLGWMTAWWSTLTESMDLRWYVALLDGEPAGLGVVCPLPFAQGGYGVGILNVRPEHRRRGVGTALHAALAAVVRPELPGILYQHVEGDAAAEATARAWGFSVVGTHHESVLDLQAVDRTAYAAMAAAPGVALDAVDPAVDDRSWRNLYAFVRARFQDAPDAEGGGGDLPFDAFREMLAEPWQLAAAHDGGRLVGVTLVVARPGTAGAANTVITGVAPAARGRGIATALKAWHALHMSERGITHVYTQNMEGNEPILAANRRLGFVRAAGHVDVVCSFS